MKRLTGWDYIAGVKTGDILNGVHEQVAFDRLAAIEDILGDDYDLDRLRELMEADQDRRLMVVPYEPDIVSKEEAWGVLLTAHKESRIAELVQADRERRCVVLDEPMRPMVYKPNSVDVYCPNCGETLSGKWPLSDADDLRKLCQCPNCGQSIDNNKCEMLSELAALKEEQEDIPCN